MASTLKTKNAFLTGGAQGLGKSYTDGLLAAGARVVFTDVNATAGEATEKEFQEKYGKDSVKFIAFDVTDGPKFEEAFQTAISFLGHVDLMVNNAGFMVETKWEKMIELNYGGVVRGTLMAGEHMRQDKGGKGGRIINISSEFGMREGFMVPIYTGTKHAVRAFTSALSQGPDVQARGIEYGILCPGPAATDLALKLDDSKVRYAHLFKPEVMETAVAPVDRVKEAFMKLSQLEEMNGAILYVDKKEVNFYKMERINLGEAWPVKESSSTSS